MSTCRVDKDTLEEISRVQAFFELRGKRLTQNQVIKEAVDHVRMRHKIPDRYEGGKQITEVDLTVKRNLLRKRGIEYKSWVLKD